MCFKEKYSDEQKNIFALITVQWGIGWSLLYFSLWGLYMPFKIQSYDKHSLSFVTFVDKWQWL